MKIVSIRRGSGMATVIGLAIYIAVVIIMSIIKGALAIAHARRNNKGDL